MRSAASAIRLSVPVGRGIYIPHGTGLVVGETSVIGDDVSILHEVTLGATGKERGWVEDGGKALALNRGLDQVTGEIVVALVDGTETTLKRLFSEED